jgi:hypothetical protein
LLFFFFFINLFLLYKTSIFLLLWILLLFSPQILFIGQPQCDYRFRDDRSLHNGVGLTFYWGELLVSSGKIAETHFWNTIFALCAEKPIIVLEEHLNRKYIYRHWHIYFDLSSMKCLHNNSCVMRVNWYCFWQCRCPCNARILAISFEADMQQWLE